MTLAEQAKQRMRDNENCACTVVEVVVEALGLPIPPELSAAASLFKEGVFSGCMCGALAGGIVISGYLHNLRPHPLGKNLGPHIHALFKEQFGASCCRSIKAKRPLHLRLSHKPCQELTARFVECMYELWLPVFAEHPQGQKPSGKSRFEAVLTQHALHIQRDTISVLQVNIGRLCNQLCHHCHVEAGPQSVENMDRATVDRILLLLRNSPSIEVVDITGGAPELNPNFRYFVSQIRAMGKTLIDRCNLTVLFEDGQADTANFLAAQGVHIVASLPCYMEENVNAQRGAGVFAKSIAALRQLNALGYGQPDTGLTLNLMFNPAGASLPPEQAPLEADYKAYLRDNFAIVFNNLFTLVNMPIKRFAATLKKDGQSEHYMHTLIDAFNAQAPQKLMCRHMLSVSWDGGLYDCDFNQMLGIPVQSALRTVWDMDTFNHACGTIAFADHCFGCTAGAGSSCGGALLS